MYVGKGSGNPPTVINRSNASLAVPAVIPVEVSSGKPGSVKDVLGQEGFSHLAGAADEYHFTFQVLQDIIMDVSHMAILTVIPKQSRLFWNSS